MEMLARVTVRSAKYFLGNIDVKDMDSAAIFVDVELRGETANGMCTNELKVEKSEIVKSTLHNPMPFIAKVTMVQTTNGRANGDRNMKRRTGKIVRSSKFFMRKAPTYRGICSQPLRLRHTKRQRNQGEGRSM